MNRDEEAMTVEWVAFQEVAEDLRKAGPFASVAPDQMEHLLGGDKVERVRLQTSALLWQPGCIEPCYCVLLAGGLKAVLPEPDGSRTFLGMAVAGEGIGETFLLNGKKHALFEVFAFQDSELIRFSEDQFWRLMACCKEFRETTLANGARRLLSFQAEELHKEKLVSLGTLAAGLMHELHNPGSAAKRAAGQLRENLMRLQELSLRYSDKPKTQPQMDCMRALLQQTVKGCRLKAMSSLEQADAEEAMAEWLAEAGVENAYKIAPPLVAVGIEQQSLGCTKGEFDTGSFSDMLNWLEALVSSVSKVGAIEESIARISDLVMAVKKFSYDERKAAQELDVHDSLQSTLTILGHKLRFKQIEVDKRFAASPSVIRTKGSALSQVWTNLIDNAVDASPEKSRIEISTWTEGGSGDESEPGHGQLVVCIADHGEGISAEALPHIFEAFFTTKPQGSGTGLGLEIVNRIVTQKFGGTIDVESQPGLTKFIVRLPMNDATGKEPSLHKP